jgi:hypothetical protein
MPEAERKDFHNSVYSGPGTGAGPAHTSTGGADTSGMEENPRLGTTDSTTGTAPAGGSIDRSSPMCDEDQHLGGKPPRR